MAEKIDVQSILDKNSNIPNGILHLITIYNAMVDNSATEHAPLIQFFTVLKQQYGKGSLIQSGPSKRLSAFLEEFSEKNFLKEGGVSLDEVGAALRDITLYFTGSDEFSTWKTGKRMREAINKAVEYVPKPEQLRPAFDGYSRFPGKSKLDDDTKKLLDILREGKIFLSMQNVVERHMGINNFAIEEGQNHIIIYIKTEKGLEAHKLEKNIDNFFNLLVDLFTKGTFKEHRDLTAYVRPTLPLSKAPPSPLPKLKEEIESLAKSHHPQPRPASSSRM